MSTFKTLRLKTEEDVQWYGKKFREAKELLDQLNKIEGMQDALEQIRNKK